MKQFSRLLYVSAFLIGIQGIQAQNKAKIKKEIIESVETHKERMIEVSDRIWEAAETSLEEFKSSE